MCVSRRLERGPLVGPSLSGRNRMGNSMLSRRSAYQRQVPLLPFSFLSPSFLLPFSFLSPPFSSPPFLLPPSFPPSLLPVEYIKPCSLCPSMLQMGRKDREESRKEVIRACVLGARCVCDKCECLSYRCECCPK